MLRILGEKKLTSWVFRITPTCPLILKWLIALQKFGK